MPDYSEGKIYKITSPTCDEVYIGSTTNTLKKRFSEHKSNCKTRNNSSKIVIESGDAIIKLVELFPCESKTELERREGEIMKDTLNCCNKQVAGRTKQDYLADNAVKIAEKAKQYYIVNADKLKKYSVDYYIENADKNADKKKEYYTENADKINKQQKQYKIENADKIKEYQAKYHLKRKQKLKNIVHIKGVGVL